MGPVSRLAIIAHLDDVRYACDFVVESAEAAGLDERAVYHCQMAVDEALTNIIEHGYGFNGDEHEIIITCATEAQQFIITIADDSPAFNPLEHLAPDPSEPLDSREPGGWGIYFIRRLMDDVSYRRAGDRNHLILVKKRLVSEADAAPGDDSSLMPVRALEGGAVVITPEGRLDSNTSPVLERTLSAQLQQDHLWLFVDMSGLDYIASSGLKVLVAAWRRAKERGGDLMLSGLQPRLIEIFEMVGFDMLFQIFPTLDDALAAHSRRT